MLTVKTIMDTLTDPKAVMQQVRSSLWELDADYPAEEARFDQAVRSIRKDLPSEQLSSAEELLCLQECAIAESLLFLFWEGLHLNLDCFYHPASRMFLQLDYEDVHREDILRSLPATVRYEAKCDTFYRSLTSDQQELCSPISSYHTYIQTAAYKLSHYLGFVLGDQLLPLVVPGYAPTRALSITYGMDLERIMQTNLQPLIA